MVDVSTEWTRSLDGLVTYDTVVSRHDGRGIGLFDGDFERSEVNFPQDSVVDLHVVISARGFGFIADEMLETRLSAVTLNTWSEI